MFFNLKEIFLEDESSIGFFLRSPVNSILRFPVLEVVFLLLLLVVEGKESDGGQSGDNKLLSHIKRLSR